ncbi:hypothetical protein Ssi03_33750 [Sphaerisporangium siamense]|nr:hypothetical protein Ssi03_33750 [Sphaerisporangium siamense]
MAGAGLTWAGTGWGFTVSVMSAPRVFTAASPAAIEIAVCRCREQTIRPEGRATRPVRPAERGGRRRGRRRNFADGSGERSCSEDYPGPPFLHSTAKRIA